MHFSQACARAAKAWGPACCYLPTYFLVVAGRAMTKRCVCVLTQLSIYISHGVKLKSESQTREVERGENYLTDGHTKSNRQRWWKAEQAEEGKLWTLLLCWYGQSTTTEWETWRGMLERIISLSANHWLNLYKDIQTESVVRKTFDV